MRLVLLLVHRLFVFGLLAPFMLVLCAVSGLLIGIIDGLVHVAWLVRRYWRLW